MALLAYSGFEGMDHPLDWFHAGDHASNPVTAGSGAEGTQSCALDGGTMNKGLSPGDNKCIVGFWWKATDLQHSLFFIGVSDFQTGTRDDGTVVATRWNGNFLARSSPGTLQEDKSAFIEIEVVMDNTVGSVRMRFNGSPDDDVFETGLDTTVGNGGYSFISMNSGGGVTQPIDDFYILDGTGPAPFNDFLSQVHVVYKPANGNGNVSQFVGTDSDSVDNYLHVDDVNPIDDDTSYVGASTVGFQDLYDVTLDVDEDEILALAVQAQVRKTAPGARAFKALIRAGGTTYVNAANHWVGEIYAPWVDIYLQNPDTVAAWDDDDVIEVGIQVV